MSFTVEEENLICIFDTGGRDKLISGIREALPDLDDLELREVTENVLKKLYAMTDAEFDALDFCPAYFNEEQEA